MSEYLNFAGDDGDYIVSAFLSDGWNGVESTLMGPPEYLAGTPDIGSYVEAGGSPDLGFVGPSEYSYLSPNDGVMGPPSELAGGDPGLIKSVEAWLKANPNLAKLGLSGVAGLAGAYSANKAGQNSLDQLKEQEAQKLRTRERVSQSILGMAPFQVAGAQPLQRLDGTRVFGQDGKIMR